MAKKKVRIILQAYNLAQL